MAKTIKIAFIGAGAINFGGAEGPWDHASRLEKMTKIKFVAIVDPLLPKAEQELQKRSRGPSGHMYKECQVLPNVQELLSKNIDVDAVFVGIPPEFRGSFEPGKDLELTLLNAKKHMFIEKPMSVLPPAKYNKYVEAVVKAQHHNSSVVSVGYMFRYHAAVVKMKSIIDSHGGKVMAFNGRYYNAYSELDHKFWWDVSRSGGPIVEQCTHFCDLARFLVGDVEIDSIQTICLSASDDPSNAGYLGSLCDGMESGLAAENRVPRVTSTYWRFVDGGGVGSLMHAVALHGKKYETQIEILMDGLRLTLYEPYHPECKLLIRDGRTGSDSEQVLTFGADDPYESEIQTFIDAIRNQDTSNIKSSYNDAAKTHELSYTIRDATARVY